MPGSGKDSSMRSQTKLGAPLNKVHHSKDNTPDKVQSVEHPKKKKQRERNSNETIYNYANTTFKRIKKTNTNSINDFV